jgi:hypothetical protein
LLELPKDIQAMISSDLSQGTRATKNMALLLSFTPPERDFNDFHYGQIGTSS